MNLAELIRHIVLSNVPVQVVVGKVTDIDESNATCTVSIQGEPIRYDVQLRSVVNSNDGFVIIPELNSYVLLGIINNNPVHSFIVAYSDIQKVLIKNTDGITFEISNTIKLNGNQYGGLVKIKELVQRLNAIENAFNELLNDYKMHNHTHPQGATTGLIIPNTQMPLNNTTINDLENNKIQHG